MPLPSMGTETRWARKKGREGGGCGAQPAKVRKGRPCSAGSLGPSEGGLGTGAQVLLRCLDLKGGM